MNLPNKRRESNNIRLAILILCLSFVLSCKEGSDSIENANDKEKVQTTEINPVSIETTKPTSSTATKIEPKSAETKPEAVSQLAENEIQIGNLVWEKAEKSGLITWANAKSYCAALSMRMPSLKELKSSHVQLNGKDSVWTANVDESDSESVWILNLKNGSTESSSKVFLNEVRCVRGL